jgi:hypothetical protein
MNYLNKYLKYKKKYISLKNQTGGECDPLPQDDEIDIDIFDLKPHERITIENECYNVRDLYYWIIRNGNDLPYTDWPITHHDEIRLIEAYYEMIRINLEEQRYNLVVPQHIMNRETIINLVNTYPTEIIKKFTSQYAHIQISDHVEDYKNMIVDLYKNLIEQIKLYQAENIYTPITIVTVGNTPYKITRLIELFSNITNINFIYLPFSGGFYKEKECTCRTLEYFKEELKKNPKLEGKFPRDRDYSKCSIIETTIEGKKYSICHWNRCDLLSDKPIKADNKYMETYLSSNPEKILNEQYTPKQQRYFEKMIINSGLKKNIDDNHKIILIDFLEFGIGFLSFLITLDKYLKKCNTIVFGLSFANFPVFNHWIKDPTLINNKLILNKYKIKYILVNLDVSVNYILLLDDHITKDRCVKSYIKDRWIDNYTNYSEQNINNCNIALLNMALILKNNKLVEM